MSEIRSEVRTVEIDMICDECGDGRMRPSGTVLTTYPPKFPHECDKCGHVEVYNVRYPYVIYE